jgi:hypothetical protein
MGNYNPFFDLNRLPQPGANPVDALSQQTKAEDSLVASGGEAIDFGSPGDAAPDPGMGFQDWLGLSSTVGGIGGQIASYFMRPKQKRPIRPTRGIGGNPMRRPF